MYVIKKNHNGPFFLTNVPYQVLKGSSSKTSLGEVKESQNS